MDPQDMGDGGEMPPTNEGASPNPENEAEPRWDEDSYEDPTQMIMEIGDLPQMERVQEALYQQLMRDHERVALELREKGEELKRAKQRREDTGVELYGVQTQLAKLQMAVETSHNQKNLIAEYRGKSEEDLESVRADFKTSKDELVDNKKQLYKNQAELDALSATLRQVELYNQEMKSEIAVTRRATYKAEEKLGNMEKDKTSQDLYIDTLNENLKELHNRLALLEAQLGSQKNETQAANETLREAGQEMESLLFEKKQLVQQWKSSLIGMQRRDEALQATNEALQQQIEAQRAVESEIEGYKNQIQKAQAAHDTLNASKEKMYSEIKFVDEQIATIMQERGKLQERYEMLQRSMNQMDVEEQKVGLQANALKTTLMNVDQNLQIVTRERQKLEVGIAQNKSTQATVSKAAKNLSKASEKVQTHIHEKEMEQTNMQNELSRIKVDSLNTSAHNMQLSETLDQLVGELKEKDGLIEKYELEIRQRNDEIEKKMYRVDRLNRKYEQLTSNMEDENTGPLEATLKNLKKEVQRVFEENSTTQREWLAKQTELVNTTSQTMQQDEKNAEYKSKQAIVQQKRIRLLQEINSNETEVKNLKNEIGLMHKDMGKLNELISKNADLEEKLNNSNFAMEISFVQELKEMEVDSVKMESKAKEAKLMKQNLVDEIVEAERQIMLWEKKIQLEKETQAALDPEVGQAEAQSMEKEIHRMKLRLETLQRDQERMIKEMERAITKRESIATRHRGKKHKEGELSHASLQKKKGGLKKDYHTSTEEVSQKEIAIKKQYEEMEVIGVEIEKSGKDFNELEEQANALQNEINNCLYEKQKNLDSLTRSQHMAKRYEELKLADPNSAMATADQQPMIEGDYSDATNELENVKDMLEALKNDYPQLAEVLTRVSNLAEIQV